MDHLVESLFHWEGGSTQERFLREGSAPRSSPLPFAYHLIMTEKVPYHIPSLELCIHF